MAERPSAEVLFKQLASTLIKRSGESVVVLLLSEKSSTVTTDCYETVDLTNGVSSADLAGKTKNAEKAANAVKYCIGNAPNKIVLSNLSWADTWQKLITSGETNCIVTVVDERSDADTVATSIISLSNKGYGCNYICQRDSPTLHSTHYNAVAGSTLITYYNESDTALTDYEVQALYAGAIAVCGTDRSLTNYTLPLIKSVEAKGDLAKDSVDLTEKGVIYAEMQNGKPRVVAGINTAEISDEITEDMQHIEVIQTMDMIAKDIIDTFVEYYRGAYKNNYDRQMLLISAIKGYFDELEGEEILDPNFDNTVDIDVENQRKAWTSYGRSEAESWSDDKVKLMSFGRSVFLEANIKICQSMEDFNMYIILE